MPIKVSNGKFVVMLESTAGTVDKIGIVLTGAYIDTQFGNCSFKYDDFVELDMVRIIVRQGEYVELDDKCATRWAVTELQKPVYPTGIGRNVLKEYIDIQSTKDKDGQTIHVERNLWI